MKPALYHTIRKENYGYRYAVMTVTSEMGAGSWRARLFGRDENGWSTNCAKRDTFGQFDTVEKAKAWTDRVAAVKQKFNDLRAPHEEAGRKLHEQEVAEINALLATVPK